MFYTDVHTHNLQYPQSGVALYSQRCIDISLIRDYPGPVSAGIHPWDTAELPSDLLECLLNYIRGLAANVKIVAVGECGLDRLFGAVLDVQRRILIRQLQIAEEFSIPCVIHCVRCFPELIALRKEFCSTPWIIHGFRGSGQIAEQLLKHGCFLSFGPGGLHDNLIMELPRERILLESDDSGCDISTIYERAATVLEMDVFDLCGLISDNFNRVFSEEWKEKNF